MTLARLLAAGTASFNELRKRGAVPLDHSATTLTGLFFARADLSRLDLSNAEFDDCNASEVDFREADLRGAFIHGGRYERCDFRGAKLEGATLENVEFVECDFTGATGLDALEVEEVTGLGGSATTAAPALEESPSFVSGHVAVNEALEAELDAHPDDEERWLVYGDWLQNEGDLRGELITRHHQAADFQSFVDDHLEQLFPGCADEVRGGGQIPEIALEWRHGVVFGATLSALNEERAVNLGQLVARFLPLPVCRFIRRLSFGLNHNVVPYREPLNDYGPVVNVLINQPRLSRIQKLEFGVQEQKVDEDYGEAEALHPWGDLSALWPHVPRLRELRVKGSTGVLGQLVLPELRAVSLEIEDLESELFGEVLAATWPRLERFELFDQGGMVELDPLLHVLSTVPLTHFALPFTRQLMPLLEGLLRSPMLRRLEVLDLHDARLEGDGLAWLRKNIAAFRHLKRFDLTGAVDSREEEALSKLGDFIVLRAAGPATPELSGEDWDPYEELEEPIASETTEDPAAPNADLDIPDEHGD